MSIRVQGGYKARELIASQLGLIKEGKGTVKQAVRAANILTNDYDTSIGEEEKNSSELVVKVETGGEARDREKEEKEIKELESLLLSMVGEGSWTNVRAPIDELMVHAGFLVLPYSSDKEREGMWREGERREGDGREGESRQERSEENHIDLNSSNTNDASNHSKNVNDTNKSLSNYLISELSITPHSFSSSGEITREEMEWGKKKEEREREEKDREDKEKEKNREREKSMFTQKALKMHIKEIQSLPCEEDRREAIRKRYRYSLIAMTPFILKLKLNHIDTVYDLITIKNRDIVFDLLHMPEVLRKQVRFRARVILRVRVCIRVRDRVTVRVRVMVKAS